MINRVVLTGRLTKDIELKYTASGKAVASFTVAVNRKFAGQNGEREADFVQCVIWDKSAEAMANFTRKGSLIAIEGRIQTRSYENQYGQRVYITEVVVESFSMLEAKEKNEQRAQEQAMPASDVSYNSDVGSWQDNQISDEDMPF